MEQIPQTAESISKLKSLQESYDALAGEMNGIAKQGENQEATNSKILETLGDVATALTDINETLGTL